MRNRFAHKLEFFESRIIITFYLPPLSLWKRLYMYLVRFKGFGSKTTSFRDVRLSSPCITMDISYKSGTYLISRSIHP